MENKIFLSILICFIICGCSIQKDNKSDIKKNENGNQIVNEEYNIDNIDNMDNIDSNNQNNENKIYDETVDNSSTSITQNKNNEIATNKSSSNNTSTINPQKSDDDSLKKDINKNKEKEQKNEKSEEKTASEEIIISATKEYYCTSNYELSGTKCTYTIINDALIKYTCDAGTLNGTKCSSSSVVEYSPSKYGTAAEYCVSYYGTGYYENCLCTKDGGTYSNNKCYKNVTTVKDATLEYYCTSESILNGTKCTKYYETDAQYVFVCPNEYKLDGTECKK